MHTRYNRLQVLLVHLVGLQGEYKNAHWVSKGESFYGDHLLYERLYDSVTEDVDALAEKIVGLEGKVTPPNQLLGIASKLTESFPDVGSVPARFAKMETSFLGSIERAYGDIDKSGAMTLGLDDYLASLANRHEENVYLLRRRLEASTETRLASAYILR